MNSTHRQYDPTAPIDCPRWFEHLPLARWGWRDLNLFGWPLVAAIVVCLLLRRPVVLAGHRAGRASCVWLIYFFRDPPRTIPDGPNLIVAPADGTVVDVTPLAHYDFIGGPAVRIGIFLSIFNVHINRAPLAGRVWRCTTSRASFSTPCGRKVPSGTSSCGSASRRSSTPRRRFAVRQISGMLARRIVCTLEPGQTVTRGEKFGMIKLGSRTELILPADAVEITSRSATRSAPAADVVARWK